MDTIMTIPLLDGRRAALAPGVYELGPRTVYLGERGIKPAPRLLSGTVDATASATLAGTDTLFLTELKVDQYVKIGTLTNPLRIKAITSNIALELDVPIDATADEISLVHTIKMPRTDKTLLTVKETKADLFASQEGSQPDDRQTTGYECTVVCGFVDANTQQLSYLNTGFAETIDPTGALTKFGWKPQFGTTDRAKTLRMYLNRLFAPGVESTDPWDNIIVEEVAAMSDAERGYDAASQVIQSVTFQGYVSKTSGYAVVVDSEIYLP